MEQKKSNFIFRTTTEFRRNIKIAAAKKDMTMNDYVHMALRNQLAADKENE